MEDDEWITAENIICYNFFVVCRNKINNNWYVIICYCWIVQNGSSFPLRPLPKIEYFCTYYGNYLVAFSHRNSTAKLHGGDAHLDQSMPFVVNLSFIAQYSSQYILHHYYSCFPLSSVQSGIGAFWGQVRCVIGFALFSSMRFELNYYRRNCWVLYDVCKC